MFSHVLPNVLGPVLVIATLQIGAAIITESTLSFLGVGVPPTQPSLGHADPDRQRLPVLGRVVDHRLPGRRAGRSWCSRSTCWATGCATRSTRALRRDERNRHETHPASRQHCSPRRRHDRVSRAPTTSPIPRSSTERHVRVGGSRTCCAVIINRVDDKNASTIPREPWSAGQAPGHRGPAAAQGLPPATQDDLRARHEACTRYYLVGQARRRARRRSGRRSCATRSASAECAKKFNIAPPERSDRRRSSRSATCASSSTRGAARSSPSTT